MKTHWFWQEKLVHNIISVFSVFRVTNGSRKLQFRIESVQSGYILTASFDGKDHLFTDHLNFNTISMEQFRIDLKILFVTI